jgi:hypothetical protein
MSALAKHAPKLRRASVHHEIAHRTLLGLRLFRLCAEFPGQLHIELNQQLPEAA